MKNLKIFKSIRMKLFLSLCIIVLSIIVSLIILNTPEPTVPYPKTAIFAMFSSKVFIMIKA